MIRFLLALLLLQNILFALQTSDKLFECTEIFKERKGELLVELERIDEQKQSLSALKTATEELLKKKKAKPDLLEEQVNQKLQEISQKEASLKKMLAENKKVLAELKSTKMSKIAQKYKKMKAGSAANILSDMDKNEAAAILQALKPKIVGKILTKMDAQKASELTLLLAK